MKKYFRETFSVFLTKYTILIFGIVAFLSTFILGFIAILKDTKNLSSYLIYGIIVFVINLFYLKLMRLSREDYENKLQREKEYSQGLLYAQKKFLRYAVHETNTPLAVIMANIELYELEKDIDTLLSNIEAATKNIYGIYDDLSYLTKKDKIAFVRQHIVLDDFLKSRIAFFNIVAKQSQLTFDFNNLCTFCSISINETKLQRIIDNNITNAIKYTKAGKVIHILLAEDPKYYIFKIESQSTIIEDPSQVFDAYYREDIAKDGLGLGLRLVKNICEEENIKITIHSTHENTSFSYYFKKDNL